MGECPDYPERQRFIPFIPGSFHPDAGVPLDSVRELEQIFADHDDEWLPPENYFLLKFSAQYIRNNGQIPYLVVCKKMEDLCFAKLLTRPVGYFNVDRCEKQLKYLLDDTKDDETIAKVDQKQEYSLKIHIESITKDLLAQDQEFKNQFFANPLNMPRMMSFIKKTYPPEEADDVHDVVGEYSMMIHDIDPLEAGLFTKAGRSLTEKDIASVSTFDEYRNLLRQKITFLKEIMTVKDTRMKGDEQLLNLWENLQTQSSEKTEWPKPPKAPELPRTTSLSPREQEMEDPPSVLPPPPTMPPSDASLPQVIVPPPPQPVPEPMEIEIPVIESPSAPPTPVVKEPPPIEAPPVEVVVKRFRGRPKKILTLDIPQVPVKKIKVASREPSETPKTSASLDMTPESASSPGIVKNMLSGPKITSSASTPELGAVVRPKIVPRPSIKDDLPIREARKRQQTFYTPTTSPRGGTPSRGSDDGPVDEVSQDSSRNMASRPGSSLPQSGMSSACPSARSSEERKVDVRASGKTTPLKTEPRKPSTNSIETQTFIIVPNKFDTRAPEFLPDTESLLQIYCKKREVEEESVESRSASTQTGPIYINPELRMIKWVDPVLKTNFLAKQIVRACYGPASKYVREKTCKVYFNVERRSVIDLPNPLRSHKNYDRIQKISKLGLDEGYILPARLSQPKYRRMINKPMDQLTIKELMAQGQIKNSLDLTLNAVLMCANNVIFHAVHNDTKAVKTAEQNSMNVIDVLRAPKEL